MQALSKGQNGPVSPVLVASQGPLPAALVLRLPALLKQGCLVEGHATTGGAGRQEALGLGVLALGVFPPGFGVCEESQERVGRAWCRQSLGGPAGEGARGPRLTARDHVGGGRALAHPLTHSLAQHAPVSTYAWALRKQR